MIVTIPMSSQWQCAFISVSSQQRSTSELLRVVVFCLASLSIMGFPLLAGFMTKNLLKYDLPYQADIILLHLHF